MEELEDDVHLCIKCRGSFYGLHIYIEHRKNGCTKSTLNKSCKLTSSNSESLGNSAEYNLSLCNSGKDANPFLQEFNIQDNRPSDFVKSSSIESQFIDSFLDDKNNKPYDDMAFDVRKHDVNQGASCSNTQLLSSNKVSKVLNKNLAGQTSSFTPQDEFNRMYDPIFHNEASVSSFLKSLEGFSDASKENAYLNDHQTYDPTNRVDENEAEQNVLKTLQKEIKQDDFLSSLELSSVKVVNEKRKFLFEDDSEDEDDDFVQRPPIHFTGGKWKPGMDSSMPESNKWPHLSPTLNDEDEEERMQMQAPLHQNFNGFKRPQYHTKGKWLPGKNPDNNMTSKKLFHCEFCNVKLTSGGSYKRHLTSQMHIRNDPEERIERDNKPSRPTRETKLNAQIFLKETIASFKRKKVIFRTELKKSITSKPQSIKSLKKVNSCKDNLNQLTLEAVLPKTVPKKVHCFICKLSFSQAYFVRHYGSLAHIHNELEFRKTSHSEGINESDEVVLQNIGDLLENFIFSCIDCFFYCNLEEDFCNHLKSHEEFVDTESIRYFFCSACPDSEMLNVVELNRHMLSESHRYNTKDEIMSAHQVKIYSAYYFNCDLCRKRFKFRRLLENHRMVDHQHDKVKRPHDFMRLCPLCPYKDKSAKIVRLHITKDHQTMPSYMCFLCGTKYDTDREAKLHRRSPEHRAKSLTNGNNNSNCCLFCYENFSSLDLLRSHVSKEHKNDCIPCMECGFIPCLKSDSKSHNLECNGKKETLFSENHEHKCELCPFSNPLMAHVLTHTLLIHGEKENSRLTCHLCKKTLKDSSVRSHMLYHTGEFPYSCPICCRSFSKELWLTKHLNVVHATSTPKKKSTFLCQLCGKTFTSRSNLHRHQGETSCSKDFKASLSKVTSKNSKRRTGKTFSQLMCELCGKVFSSTPQLKQHLRDHKKRSEMVQCPHCSYVSHSVPHLRRHLRVHSGARPFKCPHCDYRANNQENLRRHMKSGRHPGRFLYECQFCFKGSTDISLGDDETETSPTKSKQQKTSGDKTTKSRKTPHPKGIQREVFKSNLAAEFKNHLETEHLDEFDNSAQLLKCVRSYYDVQEDTRIELDPPTENGLNDPSTSSISQSEVQNAPTSDLIMRDEDIPMSIEIVSSTLDMIDQSPNGDITCEALPSASFDDLNDFHKQSEVSSLGRCFVSTINNTTNNDNTSQWSATDCGTLQPNTLSKQQDQLTVVNSDSSRRLISSQSTHVGNQSTVSFNTQYLSDLPSRSPSVQTVVQSSVQCNFKSTPQMSLLSNSFIQASNVPNSLLANTNSLISTSATTKIILPVNNLQTSMIHNPILLQQSPHNTLFNTQTFPQPQLRSILVKPQIAIMNPVMPRFSVNQQFTQPMSTMPRMLSVQPYLNLGNYAVSTPVVFPSTFNDPQKVTPTVQTSLPKSVNQTIVQNADGQLSQPYNKYTQNNV